MENNTKSKRKKQSFGAIAATFMLCYLLWLGLTWSLNEKELIVGAVVSLVVASLTARIFIHGKPFFLFNPLHFFKFVYYGTVVLMSEIIKANCDMAKRVLNPKLPTNPGFIRIPAKADSEYGLAFLCNGVTLTPGTITVDAAESEGATYIYVHWIDVVTLDREKAGELIKGRLEKWIRRI